MLFNETIEKLSEFFPLHAVETENNIASSWFLPGDDEMPVTLTSDESDNAGMTVVFALGQFPQDIDANIPLELLTINLMMASHAGPRFSFSRSTKMLTLIEFISQQRMMENTIYSIKEEIDTLVEKGKQARILMENEGYKLHMNQE